MYLGGMFRFKNITEDGTELTADAPNKHSAQLISEGDTVTLSWRPTDISVLIE